MARFVRFASRADRSRAALPAPVRRLVADRILALAEDADPTHGDDIRLVAPAGPSRGLILTFVVHGGYFVMIIYRIRPAEVWIEAIVRAYQDTPPAPPPSYRRW